MKNKKWRIIGAFIIILINALTPIGDVIADTTSSYVDSFEYSLDGNRGGTYPSQGTSEYQNGETKDTVNNFNFSIKNNTNPITKQILGDTATFDGGYHEYNNESNNSSAYVKKIVKPTSDPNTFDVQLDVIGERMNKAADVVFVLDKSSSMIENNTNEPFIRWDVLKDSFNYFADDLLQNSDYDVKFGLASFGTRDFGLAQFSDSSYFSSNLDEIKKHPIFTELPDGATATFLGVEAAMQLLTNPSYGIRNDSQKFLIFITDGLPNVFSSAQYNYDSISKPGATTGTGLRKYTATDAGIFPAIYVTPTTKPLLINGLIKKTTDIYLTIPDVTKYSIGIGSETQTYPSLLPALGPDQDYYASNENIDTLNSALNSIKNEINSTVDVIQNGIITDPMSDFVTLNASSVKSYQLNLKKEQLSATPTTNNDVQDYAKNANVNISDNQIKVTDLSLKNNEGYRITYQVTLKDEYRDGSFYPVNKGTFLIDDIFGTTLGFAVPSVKNEENFNIDVTKIWKDDKLNHPDIKINLLADGKVYDSATLTSGTLNYSFKDLPKLNSSGETIKYSVEENSVSGYTSEVKQDAENSFTITNTPIGQFVTKKEASKKILVPGENFNYKISVTNTVAGSTLKNVTVSDSMPEGISIIGNLKLNDNLSGTITGNSFTIVIPEIKGGETAVVSIDTQVNQTAAAEEVTNTATVTNPEDPDKPQKPEDKVKIERESSLQIIKIGNNEDTLLKGAIFELYKIDSDKKTLQGTFTSDEKGQINLEKLTTGTYTIVEATAPNGYQLLTKEIKLSIDKFGVITLIDFPIDMVSLDEDESKNLYQLTIKNEPQGVLPNAGGGQSIYNLLIFISITAALILLGSYLLYANQKKK